MKYQLEVRAAGAETCGIQVQKLERSGEKVSKGAQRPTLQYTASTTYIDLCGVWMVQVAEQFRFLQSSLPAKERRTPELP